MDRECEEARNMDIPKGHDLGDNIPRASDAFLGYPSWFAPILMEPGVEDWLRCHSTPAQLSVERSVFHRAFAR